MRFLSPLERKVAVMDRWSLPPRGWWGSWAQAALILRAKGLKCCPSHLGFSIYDQIFPSLPLKARLAITAFPPALQTFCCRSTLLPSFWRGCWEGHGCTRGGVSLLPVTSVQWGDRRAGGQKPTLCDGSLVLAKVRMPVILLLITCVPVATKSSWSHTSTSQHQGRWKLKQSS